MSNFVDMICRKEAEYGICKQQKLARNDAMPCFPC